MRHANGQESEGIVEMCHMPIGQESEDIVEMCHMPMRIWWRCATGQESEDMVEIWRYATCQ